MTGSVGGRGVYSYPEGEVALESGGEGFSGSADSGRTPPAADRALGVMAPRRRRGRVRRACWGLLVVGGAFAERGDDGHRRLLTRFATWHVSRRLRENQPVTSYRKNNARTMLRDAERFLAYLADRGRRIDECTQNDLDTWTASAENRQVDSLRPFLKMVPTATRASTPAAAAISTDSSRAAGTARARRVRPSHLHRRHHSGRRSGTRTADPALCPAAHSHCRTHHRRRDPGRKPGTPAPGRPADASA